MPFLYLIASEIAPGNLPNQAKTGLGESQLTAILAITFGIIGALALLVLVISGLRYVISSGDPARISKAKDGIIYSLIGLMIALTAEAIVAFVVKRL